MTPPQSNGPDQPIDTQSLKVRQFQDQYPLTTWARCLPRFRKPNGTLNDLVNYLIERVALAIDNGHTSAYVTDGHDDWLNHFSPRRIENARKLALSTGLLREDSTGLLHPVMGSFTERRLRRDEQAASEHRSEIARAAAARRTGGQS